MRGKIALIMLLVETAFVIRSESGSCDVDPAYRVDCGWVGIDEARCNAKGCCWDSSIEGKPYCYFTTAGVVPSCDIGPKPKTDCGWVGINEDTCQKRSCCWDQDVAEGTPYCYVKDFGQLAYGMCRTAPSERKDCGYVGITKEDCLGKECCYDDSVDDGQTPWCFYPPDETAAHCDPKYTSGSCRYVCDPETEPDHVYGLCSGGRWCCYKNSMGR